MFDLWSSGLEGGVDKFFIYMLSLFSVAMAASGLAFFFSAVVKIFAIANLSIALCYVFMMVRRNKCLLWLV
jgi:ATP-binding cassette subfamily G (WHITE) protein 2